MGRPESLCIHAINWLVHHCSLTYINVCRFGLSTDSADVPLSKKSKVDDEVSTAA